MTYAMLWAATLISALFFAACFLILACRSKGKAGRISAAVLGILAPLAPSVFVAISAAILVHSCRLRLDWTVPAIAWPFAFAIGAAVLYLRGLRRKEGFVPAASWPLPRTAMWMGIFLLLAMLTFWNLDSAVKAQMQAIHVQSSAFVAAAFPIRADDKDNAAPRYDEAFLLLERDAKWPAQYKDKVEKWKDGELEPEDLEDPLLGEILARLGPDLALLREAASMPDCAFARDLGSGIMCRMPELFSMFEACSWLALDARCKAAHGDLRGAAEDVAAISGAARHLSREPMLISFVSAVALEFKAAETLDAILASRDPAPGDVEPLLRVARNSYRPALQRAVQMERAMVLSFFSGCSGWDMDTLEIMQSMDGADVPLFPGFASSLVNVFMCRSELEEFSSRMGEISALLSEPYSRNHARWKELGSARKRFECGGLLAKLMIPNFIILGDRPPMGDTARGMHAAVAAVSAYKAAEGKYPSSMRDLCPRFLRNAPLDPFDGGTLRLAPSGSGVVIYSVGPDMKDDGGRLLPWTSTEDPGDLGVRIGCVN